MAKSNLPGRATARQHLFRLYPHARHRLEDFHCIPSNRELLDGLHAISRGEAGTLYMYGTAGEGRTHLLQGVCLAAAAASKSAHYVPLARVGDFEPGALLDGLEQGDIVCLDDVQAVAANRKWEEALYRLYNAQRASDGAVVVAADASPTAVPFALEDLRSRFASGLVYHLKPLGEGEQREIVQQRARSHGFELEAKTWNYIIRRAQRNTGVLISLVEKLDRISLQYKRPFTIALVKDLMGWS